MADNSIPTTYDPLIQLGEDAADGAHTHGATVGLLQNTEDRIRMELEALTGTTGGPGGKPPPGPGLKALWNAAQANKSAQTAAFRTVCSNARFYARMCIRSLFPVLGEHWNAQWNAAGFTGGSLSVPANPMTLLQQFRAYYTAHPAYETTVQGVACNAATCETTAQAISTTAATSNRRSPT